MFSNNYLIPVNKMMMIFIMSVFLVACNKGSDETKVTEDEMPVPTLSDQNIKDFTVKMAENYNANLDSLMAGFYSAKKENDAYQFVTFRNFTWTPNYIKQKNYYQKVLTENSSYLSNAPSRPLFDTFDNLIYIGINLKHVLLDKDDIKLQAELVEIKKDKAIVNRFIK